MKPNNPPSLSEVLSAVGIDRVIWIDDDFAESDPERQKLRITELLNKLFAQAINPQHNLLAEIVHTLPEGIRETKIQRVLTDHGQSLSEMIESLVQQVPSERQEGLEGVEELTGTQIEALRAALKNIETMSHKSWKNKKSSLLPQCGEKTLFLIDRQFTKEGLGEEGDEILKELRGQGKYHCIMLTRTKPDQGTELLRKQIVKSSEGQLKLSDFSVMSKNQIGKTPDDAKNEFCQALRVVFTHRHCHIVADAIGKIMKKTIDSTIDELVNHSVYDLDRAIYANSLEEGASELDVIVRILLLEQRVAAQKGYFSDKELLPYLGKLRSLRSMTPLSEGTTANADDNALRKWKREETFDEGDLINQLYSPLACGDVFQIVGTEKRFLLLVQPCDVATRGDSGYRSAEEGIFVSISNSEPRTKHYLRRYEIEHITENGGSWYLDFVNAASVSLPVLELAVFNPDGLVQVSLDQAAVDFWLPGWKKRFSNAVGKLKSVDPTKDQIPKKLAALSLSEQIPNREGGWLKDQKTWALKFKRIGRIRSPYAEAILGSFAVYHTRAAFDHDFTRGLWPEAKAETAG